MKDICIKTFSTTIDAELAKSMLAAYGIKSAVDAQGIMLASGAPSNSGPAKLFVLEKDLEKARELLI